jgi:flagellar motor switch protein FliM
MTDEGTPGRDRRTAGHCDALLKRRVAPADLAADFERFGERLAGTLRPAIAAACSDPALQIRSLGVRSATRAQLAEACGPLAANSLHHFGADERQLLLSIEARALLEQLDRAFGGTGFVEHKLPIELPLSADLLARRLEKPALAAIAAQVQGMDFRPGERGSDVAQLCPFKAEAGLSLLELEVGDSRPWRIMVALETEAFAALLPRSPSRRPTAARKSEAHEAPFAGLPLTASATLVDMEVPLHRLTDLQPGDVLPIMVARNVPLRIGDIVLARGSIGEVDDQVALQITQTFSGKENQ